MKRYAKIMICGIVMPSEKDKILEFKHYMKFDNAIHYFC